MPQVGNNPVTYNQFLQSLGTYNYGVRFFYLSSTSYQQIGQPVLYNHFDANGNAVSTILPFSVDPYQSQPAIFYDTEPDQIIITNLSSLTLTILPYTSVYFKFFAKVDYVGYESGNMQDVESQLGYSFFDDYCNYIE
jgi:hypothetical protein